MAAVLRCGIRTFRTLSGPLSGEVHVSSGFSRAKGARKRGGRANSRSLEPGAGPDDGSGTTAGGSARTSDAPPPRPARRPVVRQTAAAMRRSALLFQRKSN